MKNLKNAGFGNFAVKSSRHLRRADVGIKCEKNFNATNRFAGNESPTLPPFSLSSAYSASSFYLSFLYFFSLIPFHSWPPCYTSAEENEKPEETPCNVHAMRIIPIIGTLFYTCRAFNCCLLFQREIPPRYRDFNASRVVQTHVSS